MKKDSLFSIKKGVTPQSRQTDPDVTPQSPQEIARRLYGGADFETTFAQISLTMGVDNRVDDFSFRLLAIIKACSWRIPFIAGYPELAGARECSERAIIRSVLKLERLGKIFVKRSHNKRNEYSTPQTLAVVAAQSPSPASIPSGSQVKSAIPSFCITCKLPRKRIGMSRICVVCVRKDNLDRAVRDVLRENPGATREQVYVSLKAKKSKEVNAAFDRIKAGA